MSRLWSRPATIALAADGIALCQGGELRLLKEMQAAGWELLLAELRAMAGGLRLKRVRFVLSGQFARYAVLPPQPGVAAARDWQALAEQHLRKLYGAIADNWDVRVSLQGHGEPAVACAIDRMLIAALQEVADAAHWQVQGIEPALMALFNRHRRALPATAWLLLAEPQRLLLAEIENGCWQHFALTLPPAGEERQAAAAMLERAAQQHEGKLPAQLACYGEAALLPVTAPAGMRLLRLPQVAGANPLLLAGA